MLGIASLSLLRHDGNRVSGLCHQGGRQGGYFATFDLRHDADGSLRLSIQFQLSSGGGDDKGHRHFLLTRGRRDFCDPFDYRLGIILGVMMFLGAIIAR